MCPLPKEPLLTLNSVLIYAFKLALKNHILYTKFSIPIRKLLTLIYSMIVYAFKVKPYFACQLKIHVLIRIADTHKLNSLQIAHWTYRLYAVMCLAVNIRLYAVTI